MEERRNNEETGALGEHQSARIEQIRLGKENKLGKRIQTGKFMGKKLWVAKLTTEVYFLNS